MRNVFDAPIVVVDRFSCGLNSCIAKLRFLVSWRLPTDRWRTSFMCWVNKPRPWLMPVVVTMLGAALWAQMHGYGLPITVCQWTR